MLSWARQPNSNVMPIAVHKVGMAKIPCPAQPSLPHSAPYCQQHKLRTYSKKQRLEVRRRNFLKIFSMFVTYTQAYIHTANVTNYSVSQSYTKFLVII